MTKEIRFCGHVDQAPSLPGAYVIAIELDDPLAVTLLGQAVIELPAGRYLYCGSAKGPGGLKARLSRHFRRGKSVRWHIDQLTERGSVVGSWIFLGGDECELVRRFFAAANSDSEIRQQRLREMPQPSAAMVERDGIAIA